MRGRLPGASRIRRSQNLVKGVERVNPSRTSQLTDPGRAGSWSAFPGLPRVRPAAEPVRTAPTSLPGADLDSWRTGLRQAVLSQVAGFVAERCADELGDCGVDVAADILMEFVNGGKCLRSTFMYLGWLCGAPASDAALAAAASLELLHAF